MRPGKPFIPHDNSWHLWSADLEPRPVNVRVLTAPTPPQPWKAGAVVTPTVQMSAQGLRPDSRRLPALTTDLSPLLLEWGWESLFRVDSLCLHCRRPGFDPWVKKIPRRRAWQTTPGFLPGESHGQMSLAGCDPWGQKESDMTEQLTPTLTSLWSQGRCQASPACKDGAALGTGVASAVQGSRPSLTADQ